MPPRGGEGGGKTMKRAECDVVVYGKGVKSTFSGDINGDGLVDGLESGRRIYVIDKDKPEAIMVSIRAFIDVILNNKRWAVGYACAGIVLIPAAGWLLLGIFNPTPRYLSDAEAGGTINAWTFNAVSATKGFTGKLAEQKIEDTVAANLKRNDDVAFSRREARLAANSDRR